MAPKKVGLTAQMMVIHSAVQMVEKKVGLTAQMMVIHSAVQMAVQMAV